MRLLAIIFITTLLAACATKVTSLKLDQDRSLAQDRGYLLFGIQTNQNLKMIRISGTQNIKLTSEDIKRGTNYLFVDLKAGSYTIDSIMLNKYWKLSLEDEAYWKFNIKPNQINYVGHFELISRGYWWSNSYRTELVNRSSEALEFLGKNYPNILAARTIEYSGPGDDDFFKFLEFNDKD